MVAMRETYPGTRLVVAARPPTKGAAACALANGYMTSMSAYWRGEPHPLEFGQWLSRYWDSTLYPGVFGPADATSPHGGGGRGIRWYETSGAVVGLIPGRRGGYSIPLDAIPLGLSITGTPSTASLEQNELGRLPEWSLLFHSPQHECTVD